MVYIQVRLFYQKPFGRLTIVDVTPKANLVLLSIAHDLDDQSSHWLGRIWIPYYQIYALALVRRQMGSLQFIPMTHGLSDMEFTYGCPNTVCKVKKTITDWKDVRCVKSGVPTSDSTLGYPLWQANRGKWFKAPVVTGPELPIYMFDDPIDYKPK
ncbi:hypothetical protein PIB30_069369 [Stylosanthes scabra]|uniref:Uncharacterized protein n=1 Tax=Stylosanthes scabra TaxID=79078 RepID=A0ABU6SN82_9FABA|nr:hypothetical protein [Stylosanthes scabra]